MKKKLSLLLTLCLVALLFYGTAPIKAATYKLNATTRTLNGVGKTTTLTATVPKNSTITWKSSNANIASVSKKGVVTAKKKGTVTITCTVKNGSVTKKLTCKVTVKVPAKSIHFTNAVINSEYDAHVIELGTTYDFNAVRVSSSTKSASTDVIRFYVKDTTKATVNRKTGVVTPLKTGYTTLTVCCGSTATKATAETNTKKQVINLYIVKPTVTVTDCTLTNSHELVVNFSHEMDASTLLSGTAITSNVSIKAASDAADPGKLTGALSEDGKTLTITSENAFDGNYDISLKKAVLSKTGYALTAYSETKTLKDTVNPIYLGCTVDDTGLIVSLNFSEPVSIDNLQPTSVKRSDNVALTNMAPFLTKGNYSLSEDKKSILLDLTGIASTDQNVGIQLSLYGIVDLVNNTTEPYPLVASIYTNTMTSVQAELQNIYRNGNSVVAVFNKAMQTPGYMIANGIFQSGVINSANKKEIIYQLTDASLMNSTSLLSVVLYNYSTYNTGNTATSVQRMVNFGAAATLPMITSSSFTTKTVNSVSSTVLTLEFNENVELIMKSGYLTGSSTLDGVVGANTQYAYNANVEDKTVTITFTDSFTALAEYTFAIPASLVIDSYFNCNAAQNVRVTKLAGDTAVLPAPSNIQVAGTSNQYVYVSFDTMLDPVTAETVSNYKISGVTIQSAQLVSNNYNCPAVVKLTVPQGVIVKDAPYQITISGLEGYKGAYTTMKTYQTMITLTNNKTLEYTGIQALSSNNTVVLTFPTTLVSTTPTHIDYTATVGTSSIAIKSVSVEGSTLTITFNQNLTKGKTLILTPSSSNYLVDVNNQRILNIPISVVIS